MSVSSEELAYHNTSKASRVLQMKLDQLSLDNKTRPGHFKKLVLRLPDPNRRNVSTGMVACQRQDCWVEEPRQKCARLRRSLVEALDGVISFVDNYPISLEEAERTSKEFEEARKEFRKRHMSFMREVYRVGFRDR